MLCFQNALKVTDGAYILLCAVKNSFIDEPFYSQIISNHYHLKDFQINSNHYHLKDILVALSFEVYMQPFKFMNMLLVKEAANH